MKVRYRVMKPDVTDEQYRLNVQVDSYAFSRPTITTIKEMKRLATKIRTVDHHDLSSVHLYTAKELVAMVNSKLIPPVDEFDPSAIFNEISKDELSAVPTEIESLTKQEFMETRLTVMLDVTIGEYRRLKRNRSFLIIMCNGGYVLNHGVRTEFPKECFVVSVSDMASASAKYFKQAEDMAKSLGVGIEDDFTLGVPIVVMNIETDHYINLPANTFVFNLAVPSI